MALFGSNVLDGCKVEELINIQLDSLALQEGVFLYAHFTGNHGGQEARAVQEQTQDGQVGWVMEVMLAIPVLQVTVCAMDQGWHPFSEGEFYWLHLVSSS